MNLQELSLSLEEFGLQRILDGADIGNGIRMEEATQAQLATYAYRCDLVRKQLEEHLKVVKSNQHSVKKEIASRIAQEGAAGFDQYMEDGTKVSFKLKYNDHISIRKGQEFEAFLWLFSQGMSGIVKEYVHPASLKAQIHAFMSRGVEEDIQDEDFDEMPSWVDLSDPESKEAWEDYKENKRYLNISAEEAIAGKIKYYEEMRDKVRAVPLSLEPPEDSFTRYVECTTDIRYRRL